MIVNNSVRRLGWLLFWKQIRPPAVFPCQLFVKLVRKVSERISLRVIMWMMMMMIWMSFWGHFTNQIENKNRVLYLMCCVIYRRWNRRIDKFWLEWCKQKTNKMLLMYFREVNYL